MPNDGDGREHESEKAENRDGKEDVHSASKKDIKVHGVRAHYSMKRCRFGWMLQAGSMIPERMDFLAEAV
jgi:hypothetical protein